MRRRYFIAGSIAVAAEKSVLPSSAWAQSAPRINRIIDAHCHVFNAADLPIEGFTKKIMVPKSAQTSELVARFADYPGALEALVHAITVQVKRAAPLSELQRARSHLCRRPGDDFLGFRIEGLDRVSRRTQRLVHHARAQ